MGKRIVDAELNTCANDFSLGHIYDRRMDVILAFTLDSSSSGKVCSPLKGRNVFRPAIRIAAVVGLVGANENIKYSKYFCPSEGITQKYRISRRHIGHGNIVRFSQIGSVLGHI